ncbi:MAG TPA: CehA/McbA family metallohydrolase [Thermoanaerobaculia bacterium]|nr:CehA/McbA family metallohydrolase [Thermoanaerobaculia bacterium]
MSRTALAAAVLLWMTAASVEARWLKGNTHTHTLRSDGDASPETVVRWYRDHGYDFLVLTDHDQVTRLDGGGLLLIPGEEVTDKLPRKPLHICALGVTKVVKPQGGATPVEVLQHDIDAVRAAGGIPVINHPNFGWSFGADELRQLRGVALLEIASGHPLVNMDGPPSVESMWDALLMAGKRVFAVAVDDAHHYGLEPPKGELPARPGQGWVVVRADKLAAADILTALERGDFYASTGPALDAYDVSREAITVTIRAAYQTRYRVQFLSRGSVLQETVGMSATYRIRGDEGYVRAKVLDSNGKAAWMQPVMVTR